MSTPTPYDSPAEWLDDEIELLRATIQINRLARRLMEADHDHDEDEAARLHRSRPSASQLKARHKEATAKQQALKDALDARLEVHRASAKAQLPIDAICEEDALSDEARKILIAAAIPALDRSVGEYVLGEPYCGTMAVGELIRQVLAPSGAAEWVRCRLLFHRDSLLRARGHLLLSEPFGPYSGETLGNQGVTISVSTFARLVGEPRLLQECEGDPCDEQAES